MKNILKYITVAVLTGFGLLTFFLSISILLDLFGVREKEGNYVLFVVWTNFISSLIYIVAVYGFLKMKKWTTKLLASSFLILLLTFIGFLFYINSGGIHETKTVGALVFRMGLTLVFITSSYFLINKNNPHEN
ncbi:MAG: hypothetical protein A3K10_10965 [Bacteroidetes bacterium RIFCSPLOWO2_12_FULL_31_6]|nr:MAG: hypothetical protein A3K10_10965 [Bacteroidetes bacterium RIFCSPLOWO2_12_FULL_31_6]